MSPMLDVSPVRAFADNYIWIVRAATLRTAAIVVDPGDARPVQAALEGAGLELRAILVTHHHADPATGRRSTGRPVRASRASRNPWPTATASNSRTSGSNSA